MSKSGNYDILVVLLKYFLHISKLQLKSWILALSDISIKKENKMYAAEVFLYRSLPPNLNSCFSKLVPIFLKYVKSVTVNSKILCIYLTGKNFGFYFVSSIS